MASGGGEGGRFGKVEDAIGEELVDWRGVGGGCDAETYVASRKSGELVFVKFQSSSDSLKNIAELKGLEVLHETTKGGRLKIPKPLAASKGDGMQFLALEYFDMGHGGDAKSYKVLGEELAALHKAGGAEKFGFEVATFCGATKLDNTWEDDWITFYRERRLRRMLDALKEEGEAGEDLEDGLLEVMDGLEVFFKDLDGGDEVKPALLHGDLWMGNIDFVSSSHPTIFDPASFYGHSEFDLSLMTMFGSPKPSFWPAYWEAMGGKPSGFENRRHLYQLFHYLNHLLIFGSGYRGSSMTTLAQCLRILKV